MFEDMIRKEEFSFSDSKNIDNIDNVLKTLINLNYENRFHVRSENFSFSDYALEYCTIKCDIGRQTGKSNYIKKHADDRSLVVVMNNNVKKCFQIENRKFDLFSAGELINPEYINRIYETIYFDEPSFIFKILPVKRFYKLLSKSYNQTYIWLGM